MNTILSQFDPSLHSISNMCSHCAILDLAPYCAKMFHVDSFNYNGFWFSLQHTNLQSSMDIKCKRSFHHFFLTFHFIFCRHSSLLGVQYHHQLRVIHTGFQPARRLQKPFQCHFNPQWILSSPMRLNFIKAMSFLFQHHQVNISLLEMCQHEKQTIFFCVFSKVWN